MNNKFKSNSRFAVLSEPVKKEEKKEVKPEPKIIVDERPKTNHFKQVEYTERPKYNERPMYTESNSFSQKVNDKAQQQRNEEELKKHIIAQNKALSIDNFPDLNILGKRVETIQKPFISFSEKLKKVDIVVEEEENHIPYGWALIKRDKTTNKSFIEYNKDYENDVKREERRKKALWPIKVLDALVDLYEKEKTTYINKWGYDAYEDKYLDPDYDDEYFDRLDEAYENDTDEYESETDEYEDEEITYYRKH